MAARRALALAGHAGVGVHDRDDDPAVVGGGGDEDVVGEGTVGHADLLAVEHPAVAVAPRGGDGVVRVGAGLDEGGGEQTLAVRDAGQEPLLLLVAAELGDRQRAEHDGGQVGHGRHRAAELLEHDRRLEEPVPAAAVRLGEGDAEQAGLGELRPQLAVEVVLTGLDLLEALVGDLGVEDLLGEALQVLLLLVEGKVHVAP